MLGAMLWGNAGHPPTLATNGPFEPHVMGVQQFVEPHVMGVQQFERITNGQFIGSWFPDTGCGATFEQS
jgi:hypothetical protein